MPGKVLELFNIIEPQEKATRLTQKYIEWNTLRRPKMNDWEEIRRYVYATDTSQTTNSMLPWKNRTTIPKLCQIRDNLYSNYSATLFPKRKYVEWEANEQDSNSKAKRDAITNYMAWVISQPSFKHEMDKIIMDYIDYGNCFATVEWIDERAEQPGVIYANRPYAETKVVWTDPLQPAPTQTGFVGPALRRISPLDIVMNPTSENFQHSPKFIRSVISMGEIRDYLARLTTDENRAEYEALYEYLKFIRYQARVFEGDWIQRDHLYNMDGFTSFRAYLLSDFVEVLTFYGDLHDYHNDIFEKNRVITVVDRHRLIGDKPNPSYFGYPPIFHVPWRKKQDNLWGMGPLDNLVGMQYRLDHVENMRADVADLCTYPVQLITGFVEDYTWQPGEKIFASDEGHVEIVQPKVELVNANFELQQLQALMEEMAGAPKEAMGFRSPGEKTKYEVQRLENASSRIYQNKIRQFEEHLVERVLNAMLELGRRNMAGAITIPIFNDDLKVQDFQTLTVEDITGIGRIKPVAARHFAEQAELVQNLTNLTGSNLWQTVMPHFSGVRLAKTLEKVFDIEDLGVVMPFAALAEQAEGQKMMQALQEQVHMAGQTATGQGSDYDMMPGGQGQEPQPQAPFDLQRQPSMSAQPQGLLGTM